MLPAEKKREVKERISYHMNDYISNLAEKLIQLPKRISSLLSNRTYHQQWDKDILNWGIKIYFWLSKSLYLYLLSWVSFMKTRKISGVL